MHQNTRTTIKRWYRCLFVISFTFFCGCGSNPDIDLLFSQAEYLVLEQEYDEAMQVLRTILQHDPYHSGAHYYLGRCLFASQRHFWFAVAEGEIKTALALFIRDGRVSRIERFSPTYFELICHLDLSKIQMRQAMFLIDYGARRDAIEALIDQAMKSVDQAAAVDPESPDIVTIRQGIEEIRAELNSLVPRRSAPPVSRSGRLV